MLAFSTTPPTHIVNILLKNIKMIFVYIVVLKQWKKQFRNFSENFLCFLYKYAKLFFFMLNSMGLISPLMLRKDLYLTFFVDNKVGTNYFELIEFMN